MVLRRPIYSRLAGTTPSKIRPCANLPCAAPCRPGAAPGLGGFGGLPVLAGTRHICARKMVRPAGYAPASRHWHCRILASGRWPLKSNVPRRHRCKPSGLQPSAGLIKNEHHYELVLLVPTGISRWMFRCFRHTSPATFNPYFHIE
jgi:hypothetical protein